MKGMTAAKILVDGGPGTGKTTFIGSVSDIDPVSTEVPITDRADARTTTATLDFGRLTVDGELNLLLFGTPSNGRLPFVRDDLAAGALGVVVLVDPRRPADSYPALESVERRGLPFVVAVNSVERDPGELDQAIRMGPDVPVSVCDARERASAKAVLMTLFEIILEVGTMTEQNSAQPQPEETATLLGIDRFEHDRTE